MKTIFTEDFQEEVFKILKEYDNKPFNLMISGGSLLNILNYPKYESLATSKWNIYFSDERVDPEGSNFEGAKPFISLTKGETFRIPVDSRDCLKEYANLLPSIDVCLLGIGPDGHICSLFPNTLSLTSQEKVIYTHNDSIPFPDRVTTTLAFLNSHVSSLYFIIPPKDGKVKDIKQPHPSILIHLKKDFTSVLHSSLKD